MKITLLGTAAAEGWPGLFCRCAACKRAIELGGRNIRTRSSALVDDRLLIDFPPDTYLHVLQHHLDLTAVQAVLITHAHDDHFCVTELQYRGPYFVVDAWKDKLPIVGPIDVVCALKGQVDLQLAPLEPQCIAPGETTALGGYRITGIPAPHDPALTCLNYVIADPSGASVLYATDTGVWGEAQWRAMEGIDIDALIVECTKGPIEGGYNGHLSVGDVKRMRAELIRRGNMAVDAQVVTTHHSHNGGMVHDDLQALLEPAGIVAGYDGLQIEVSR
ncbi:MAG: MBL fold metallo-hydrolase [Armatimonadetes bacterium]|nr:MBL fold metallo-hydrolase [Armatimonadota bacterium]MDE2207454.1 MBL fold metallo-hydrolase [Armatimonadota bacterium]